MKNFYCLIGFLFFNISNIFSQIQLPNVTHLNAMMVAQELAGDGVTIISSTLLGDPLQIGKFNNGSSVMDISDGILLTTGDAKYAEKYLFSYSNTDHTQIKIPGEPVYSFDSDLNKVTNGPQIKPVALEIEFISNNTNIEFEFVFASLEYPAFVGSSFNDAFVFTLSGPGINSNEGFINNGVNIAKLPNGDPISINTVNQSDNTNYFTLTGIPPLTGVNYWTYPGKTIPIIINREIECNQVYKLRLVISNISDDLRDSGVFLKKGSLKSPSTFISNIIANPTIVCEGESLNLTVNGDNGYTYEWSDGQSGIGLNSISTTATLGLNNYTVTAYSSNGCIVNSQNVNVIVHPNINQPPFINGMNNTGNYKAYVRAGENINFQIPTFDNISEEVILTFLSTIDGASHDKIIQNQQIGSFSWTPDDNDIGEHAFQVYAEDNNICSSLSSETYNFTIIVICRYCEIGIEYANRYPNNNPVPPLTEMAQYIVAGVTGEVVIGQPTVFRAGEFIVYGGNWDAGDEFEDFIEPVCEEIVCEECCDNSPSISITSIPNVFTPNGDGFNDVWYVPDFANPYCAFNAQRFELQIFNMWDQLVYSLSENHNNCCPFTSPSQPNTGGYSSIFWNGTFDNGEFVIDGNYAYILRIWGCNNEYFDQAGMIQVLASHARYSNFPSETTINENISSSIKDKFRSDSRNINTEILAFPNPFKDSFTIKVINIGEVKNFYFKIINSQGQAIESGYFDKDEYKLNCINWSSGIYFCLVFNEEYSQTLKIIKQ